MGSSSYRERLATIVSETSLLVSAVDGADLSVPVPSCPDWTLNQLLRHVGHAHRWVAQMVGERFPEIDRSLSKAHSVSGYAGETADVLGPWLTEGAALISDTLLAADPQDMIAVVLPGVPGPDFWSRRMAHETVVHRWDAAQALGLPFEVAPSLADDGLHEWMTTIQRIIFTLRPEATPLLGTGVLYFEATDTGAQWTVDLTGNTAQVTEGEQQWSASLRAPAFDLLLTLLQRRPPADLEATGDHALLNNFLGAMRF
ncbi:maleylpyruvate isomerase family mycothiol-dependent enzyme [Nocardia sp. NRRL S-836]|uniref:maleylpyruvate isomerase family mycothiol-dependent enzyme n=1 Tax=Nocardia sp. NRRL S-836 TaxID=1519492 RepID=UPI0006AEFB46|nr:maleylpyruvate isomerase family mycothiol-dependent enzyme [Nocardia sp. NRRL S-836]KOV79419.1 hypothetical protein ADL03_36980 [Nocardia sp. NRRL S-836]